jgi:hypothetical protein
VKCGDSVSRFRGCANMKIADHRLPAAARAPRAV